MNNGKIVFFGTSDICLPFLEIIHSRHELRLIITQPDARGGRNRAVITPAAKEFALQHAIPVLQPQSLKAGDLLNLISGINPDLGVVIAYGKIIPKSIFSLPRFKTINLHFSLLPRYRGAAPVQRAILQGETESGVTIFELSPRMDRGKILAQQKVPISPKDTSQDLFSRLVEVSKGFLLTTIDKILKGKTSKITQDHAKATYAPPIRKAEGRIDWKNDARGIMNQFRAFAKWPGAYFYIGDIQVKITRAGISSQTHAQKPGEVLALDQGSMKIGCGDGSVLEIFQFQPQNKKVMTPHSYSLGNDIPDRLN